MDLAGHPDISGGLNIQWTAGTLGDVYMKLIETCFMWSNQALPRIGSLGN